MIRDKEIRNLKPSDKPYPVGLDKGLYMTVHPNGSKYIYHRYMWNGTRTPKNIGVYPFVSLAEAREFQFEDRIMFNKGINPNQKNEQQKQNEVSFRDFGNQWFSKYEMNKAKSTTSKVKSRLENDLYPFVGNKLLTELKPQDFMEALDKCIKRGAIDTAHRVLRHAKAILDDALTLELIDRNVCDRLVKTLPTIKKGHFPAIVEPKRFGWLLNRIDEFRGNIIAESGLKLAPLLFVRHLELRSMRWADIDFDNKEWRFHITKTDINHIVPLATQVIDILNSLKRFTGDDEFVFASNLSSTGYISENTLSKSLNKLVSKEEMVIHGFRASARTILNEELGIDPYVIEHQLAHDVPDILGKAYNRTKFIKQRKEMMQQWADFCDKIKK